MKIVTCNHITDSELAECPGDVLVLDSVELLGRKPNKSIFAGILLPNGDGAGLVQLIKIEYHFGRMSWVLSVEHSTQIATRYDPISLPEAIAAFETLVGIELPDARVIEYGIGVYGAKTRLESENPFALVNGGFYQVCSPSRGTRTFVADVRNGQRWISFLDVNGNADATETFDPAVALSLEDWRSLTLL